MNLLKTALIIFSVIIAAVFAHADGTHPQGIVTDGSIGTAGKLNLPGPDYEIRAEYGSQSGQNLFHSFEQFNLHAGENAIFTGPDSVKNIVSRVTGGNASWIDGKLGSAIPGADLYFLNPAGVMFGPDAALDITGAFHVSTADYLRMGETERFFAAPREAETLSVAAPAAFGFLDNDIAAITFEGRGKLTEENWKQACEYGADCRDWQEWSMNHQPGLSVTDSDISIIGGDISLSSGTFFETLNADVSENVTVSCGSLNVCNGDIHIASAASAGEVRLTASGPDMSDFDKMGNIRLSEKSLISVRGDRAGNIFIRCGQFLMDDSSLEAEVYGNRSGGGIDIQADSFSLNNGYISGSTFGYGKGGDIRIRASESVRIFGNDVGGQSSAILSDTNGFGDAGNILIETKNLSLNDGAQLTAAASGAGKGGDISIYASESADFSGNMSLEFPSIVSVSSLGEEANAGDAGNIMIETKNLLLNDGAQIASASAGGGKGGDINIHASESVVLSGNTPGGFGSSIVPRTSGKIAHAGDAGDIVIETKNLSLNDGAWIASHTEGTGKSGNITVTASESLNLSGSDGRGHQSLITASSVCESPEAGDAGMISIETGKIELSDRGTISTGAAQAGGGEIKISVSESLEMSHGRISTGVSRGDDNAGDITLGDPNFITLNHSEIIAKAYQGRGGNIHIAAKQFIRSSDSDVNASSELGIDGSTVIDSPETRIAEDLNVLPGNLLDPVTFPPCSGESRFFISGKDAAPTPLDDWLPSPPLPDGSEAGQFYRRGDFENILRSREQTVSNGNVNTAAYLTIAYTALGQHRKALSALETTLPFIVKSKDSYRNALFFSLLGDLYFSLGNRKQAKKYLEKGLEQARLAKDADVMATVLNNMANYFAAESSYFDAIALYEESLENIKASEKNKELKLKVLINRLNAQHLNRDDEHIVAETGNALLYADTLPDSYSKAADLVSLSLLARKMLPGFTSRDTASEKALRDIAYRALNKAAQIAETLTDTRIASYSCGYLGQLYESESRYPKAFQLTRKALFLAQQTYSPEILYRWQWQSARLFTAQGDIENAVKAYHEAISALNPVRRTLFAGYRSKKDVFYEEIKPVYLGLAELLLRQAETSETFREESLKAAKDTMESLKKAELQNFFQDECLTAKQKKTADLNRSPEHTAVIYPIPLPDRLALLLILPDGIKQIDLSVNSESLNEWAEKYHVSSDAEKLGEWARRFRERLQKRTKNFKRYAKDLYDWLIRPIESELISREINTLIVVPDGALRLIPFSALHDGEHFLVEKYAVVTLPSVTLTVTDPAEPLRVINDTHILLGGLSDCAEPKLPFVKQELKAIHEIMGDGQIMLDEDFTKDNLMREFGSREYGIVHISTHGSFGASPEDTYLQTCHRDKLTITDIEQLLRSGSLREQPVDLLTLSACETAMGDEQAALGLAGIAIKAGVGSAVAALWPVTEAAAYEIMVEFYRQIKSGIPKGYALRNAQIKLLAGENFSHPADWSPFLLIGQWL